jgi:hypothetical protein
MALCSVRKDAERSLANARTLLSLPPCPELSAAYPDHWGRIISLLGRAEKAASGKRFAEAILWSADVQRQVLRLGAEYELEMPRKAWAEFIAFEDLQNRAEAGLHDGILPSTAPLEEFLCLRPEMEDALAGLWASGRYFEMRRRLEDLRRDLDILAADPCEALYRQALWAKETGKLIEAKERLARLSGTACLSPDLRRLGETLQAEADLLSPSPSPSPPAVVELPPAVRRPPSSASHLPSPATPMGPPIPVASLKESFLSMDVWQSAWGNWEGVQVLLDYLKANHIKEVNLNPGLNIGPKNFDEAYRKFKPLVERFRAAGVERINFLYAELGYPLEGYAQFLVKYRDLGIDTVVDDSEFSDMLFDRFGENLEAVKRHGLGYACFVTVEGFGNSGVSDKTRYWVLENVDQPMLMSYFTCDLEEQKKWMGPYLAHADAHGKDRAVKIAFLLGNKHVGRERSCEKVLDETALQKYIAEVHAWGLTHPSYGGIILETNLKTPKYAVCPEPLP